MMNEDRGKMQMLRELIQQHNTLLCDEETCRRMNISGQYELSNVRTEIIKKIKSVAQSLNEVTTDTPVIKSPSSIVPADDDLPF